MLYRYLSGVEFRQRVEAIVEAFERMREDLDLERHAAERQWAKRTAAGYGDSLAWRKVGRSAGLKAGTTG